MMLRGLSLQRSVGQLPGYVVARFSRSLAASRITSRHLLRAIFRLGLTAILIAFQISSGESQDQTPETAAETASEESLFKEGQTLAAEWNQASLRKAIERFEAARSAWRSKGDVQNEVRALNAAGEILISLSEYQQALKAFSDSLALSKTPSHQAKALNGLSLAHLYLGDEKKALDHSQRAYYLSQRANDLEGQAESLVHIGEVYYFLGQNQKSLKTIDQALSIWPDRAWRIRARALIDKGYAYFDQRSMDQALDYYEQALDQSRSQGDRRGEALALTAIGGVYSYLGNKQTALDYQNQAVTLFRDIGDRNGEGVALNGLGYAYRNFGENQKSLECYLQALELFRLLGNREYETFTITRVGKAYEGLENSDKALEYYRLALGRATVYSQSRAHALNSIGTVLVSTGRLVEALAYYHQSLRLFRATGDKMSEASILNSLGKIYSSLGRKSLAQRSYQQALSICRAVRDRREEIAVLLNLAKAERELGNYHAARERIEDSLKIIESLRKEVSSFAFRSSYFASVRQHYETYIDVLMHLHKAEPQGRFAEAAFSASEKARARSLLEQLGEASTSIRQGVDPALIERERALKQELNNYAERHMLLLAGKQAEAAAQLLKEIDLLSSEYDQIEARIRQTSPRFAALTQPEPLSIEEIRQRVLDPNTLLLELSLGDERSYVWAVSQTEIFSYELPGRARIESAARDVYASLTANQSRPGELTEQRQSRVRHANEALPGQIAELSKMLLDPVASKLDKQRLLIVADGALQYIPFQILTKPVMNRDGERRGLLVDHEILNEPSASALALLIAETTGRKAPTNSVAVFADPVFKSDDPRVSVRNSTTTPANQSAELQQSETQRAMRDVDLSPEGTGVPRLLASREEAEAIMSVAPWWSGYKALGFEASRATAMRSDLGDYRIVHFATHGILNNQHPELSGIVLSLVDQKGQPQDGFLRLHDIYNLKLPVDLVVLSACNTGLGKDVRGEGLVGLTRGFMYAGASSVVASLWKVDDEATAELMRYFYEFMLKDGLAPAAALRQAQLKMSQQGPWQSPYYWAGFVIQGEYTQTMRTSNFPTNWIVWGSIAAIAIALALGGLLVLKRRRKNLL